jgi:hypothetical protein
MAKNLQLAKPLSSTAQPVNDQDGNDSSLALSTDKVGIGTTNPTQKLTLGSGNILLPRPRGGEEGNLFFGGITDKGEIGMRLSGGDFGSGQFQCGFIDVRAGNLKDGLRFRVDTFSGATERMRIDAVGNVGINTPLPESNLHIGGATPNILLFGNTMKDGDGLRVHYNQPLRIGGIDVKGASLRLRGESEVTGVGATDRLCIDLTNGNVGIGTTEPKERLDVNGNIVTNGDILLTNADCAEDFDICDAEQIEPGTVMVLGEDGLLHQSFKAYDKCVAGVISGAGEYKPGIVLDKQHSKSGRKPVALLGKAFCKVDAQYGAIEVGDLLTTAPTPGHAMKVGDPLKAFGTVIGKALRPLAEGQGLIPILIALQ